MRTPLVLCLLLALGTGASAKDARPAPAPRVGLGALDPFDPAHRDPAALAAFADLGGLYVRSAPIDWDVLEPQPQRSGPPRYEWKALDEAVLVWQLAGLRPVLVLTPRSRWASLPADASAWAQAVRDALPAAEAAAGTRGLRGCGPPRPGTWTQWERFVRDVVERYDGDGEADMPGLRAPVRYLQVLDRLGPDAWVGSVEEYLRVLHHAGQGAHFADEATRVLTACVDVQATGQDPYPDRREWDFRIGQLVPKDARLARLEVDRGFAHLRRLLEVPPLYDVLAQVGNAHHADDASNLRFLRRALDEADAKDKGLWLVDSSTRKLGAARTSGAVPPREDEERLRQRWLPAATQPAHPRHAQALAWLRRGQAFDLVRGLCGALAAGADVVLFQAPFDHPREGHPDGLAARGQGLLAREPGDAPARGWTRTPSFWALAQALRRLDVPARVDEAPFGSPGRSVVFRRAGPGDPAWVAVLLLDPRLSWAGAPGAALPLREVLVPVPSGRYVLEDVRLGPEAPRRTTVEVREGMFVTPLGPAPVYLLPEGG